MQLTDIHFAKNILENVEKAGMKPSCDLEKRAVIKALILSTWLQRMYFIIRSFLMGQIGVVISFSVVWYLEYIDVIQNFFLGVIIFISGLLITRLFDNEVTWITKKIVIYISRHKRIRNFVMNHF